jgi:hypothetical protein
MGIQKSLAFAAAFLHIAHPSANSSPFSGCLTLNGQFSGVLHYGSSFFFFLET